MAGPGRLVLLRLAVLAGIPLALTWRALFLGEIFPYEDLAAFYYPRESLLLRHGIVGWDPYILLGTPLLGDPQTAPYEPVRALARAMHLDVARGLTLFLVTYLVVAVLGAERFARRMGASERGALLATLALVGGGIYAVRFHNPQMFPALCLLPWVAIAADRFAERRTLRDALAVAVLVALGALGGHPQAPYMTWLFVVAWVAVATWPAPSWRARLAAWGALAWRGAIAVVAFAALIAVHYAPVVAYLASSARRDAGIAFAGSFAFTPLEWPRIVVPDLFGNDMAGTYSGPPNYHEQLVYLGVAPLFLAALAIAAWWSDRRVRTLAVIAAAALLLAAGRWSPLFYAAWAIVPGFASFRAPARYAWFLVLAASALAGIALTRVAQEERPANPSRVARGLVIACGALVITCVAGAVIDDRARWAFARAALAVAATGLVLLRFVTSRLGGARAAALLFAITAVDLGAQWLPYRQTLPAAVALPNADLARFLARAAPERVLVHMYGPRGEPAITPWLNEGEAAGYLDVRGYSPAVDADVLALFAKADLGGLGRHKSRALAGLDPAEWFLDLAGVRYIVGLAGAWPDRWKGLPVVAREPDRGIEVRARTPRLPRAWLVAAAETLDDRAALDRLPTLDAARVATVDGDVGLPPNAAGGVGAATIVTYEDDQVAIDADASAPALLVLSDRFGAGWRATIDGAAAPIAKADYLFRGVRVEPGRHRVVFTYARPF